jgi:hypothetical protein
MVTVDFTAVIDQIIALAIVFLPIEVYILKTLIPIRRLVGSFVPVLNSVYTWVGGLSSGEARKVLFSEMGHGIFRALKEQAGSANGVAARANKAGLIEAALSGGAGGAQALSMLPGKIDLPVVGKVTIGEALQLAQTLQGVFQGGGLQQLLGKSASGAANAGGGTHLP